MNNYKSISILIPVYNERNTIEKCINRVLNSNTLNLTIEIIISDNNSSDNTKEIILNLIEEHPRKNIKYHFKKQGIIQTKDLV